LILGDALHNFIDGIIIGLAFIANPLLGLPTALAIAAHEVPQEIGDFSILLQLGWKKKTVVIVNILQSLLTVPGAFVGYYIGEMVVGFLPLALGVTAGVFLYIAASDLIPELHHQSGHEHFFRILMPMLLAIGLVYFFKVLF
jgi:zinc and cadmium transporter